jgi:pantoate--beta-alanine ligase
MLVIKTSSELRKVVHNIKKDGKTIAFVPTMGHLHDGHLSLVKLAHQQAEIVIVSIFVNPLQFNQVEDLKNYPRTLDSDIALCDINEVDIIFIPSENELYTGTLESNRIELPQLSHFSSVIEGAARPDHFSGVVTIVKLLFELVQPNFAVFGEKDFQQLLIIKNMVSILNLPVEIISGETTREIDGLAMSSRNSKLSKDERKKANQLYKILVFIRNEINSSNDNFTELIKVGIKKLIEQGFKPDYLEVCDSKDLQFASADNDNDRVILAAVWLGNTRLIDNIKVSIN